MWMKIFMKIMGRIVSLLKNSLSCFDYLIKYKNEIIIKNDYIEKKLKSVKW